MSKNKDRVKKPRGLRPFLVTPRSGTNSTFKSAIVFAARKRHIPNIVANLNGTIILEADLEIVRVSKKWLKKQSGKIAPGAAFSIPKN